VLGVAEEVKSGAHVAMDGNDAGEVRSGPRGSTRVQE
jgi:hypothetical protein